MLVVYFEGQQEVGLFKNSSHLVARVFGSPIIGVVLLLLLRGL